MVKPDRTRSGFRFDRRDTAELGVGLALMPPAIAFEEAGKMRPSFGCYHRSRAFRSTCEGFRTDRVFVSIGSQPMSESRVVARDGRSRSPKEKASIEMTDGTSGRRTAKRTRRSAKIPTGTVTFLFTDIEGSTAMWEDYPTQMQDALARHDEILQAAVESHGGYVFKMIGDACCAAFGNAREALGATLAAQRALFAEEWGENISIRVRMGLHTGVAEEREGDYFGPPVNRVARLLSAGHGGQVLLSAVTYGLVRDVLRHMEPGSELRDLGEHRLRDLRYTERLYQLVVPDLPSEFPPPRGEPISAAGAGGASTTPTTEQQQTPPPQDTPATVDSSPTPAPEVDRGAGHAARSLEEEKRAAAAAAAAAAGKERYTRERLIGSGGMAEVYLAHDEVLDRDVALKVLRNQYSDDERFVERFEREAKNAASLSHPNIVAVYDRGETENGSYYIAMEYVGGGTLKDRITREGALAPRVATGLTLEIAKALQAAHKRGVIHRDIKPQNVLLTEEGDAKVADFGIARAASSSTMTKTGSVLGTAHYISPEQALGQPASARSDLYSLGVVLYEMLTGELPYDAETPMGIAMRHVSGQLRAPKEVRSQVPEGINEVAIKLLAKDPKDRYESAQEVVEDLGRLLRQEAPALGGAASSSYAAHSAWADGPPAAPPAGPPQGPPPAGGADEASTGPQAASAGARELPSGGPRVPPRALAVAAAGVVAVALLGVAAWVLVPNLLGGGAGETVEVPSLEGKTLAAARQLVGEDFELVMSSEQSSTEPKGTILRQRPNAGARVRQGEEISVAVSSGGATQQKASVPDVVGRSEEEAQEVLKSEGFGVNVNSEESDEDEAGKVVGQSPPGGSEVEEGSEVQIAVGEAAGAAPGYNLIQDATGSLSAEVPPGWGVLIGADSEGAGGNWSNILGYGITSSITTAPDLQAWHNTAGATGAYIVASRALAQSYTDDELFFLGPNQVHVQSASCPDTPQNWDRPPYSGKIITCNNYDGTGATLQLVVAAPAGRECVVVLQVRTLGEADARAGQHILDTFEADCGGIAGAKTGDAELADAGEGGASG